MKDRPVSLSKKLARRRVFWYNEGEEAREQEGERVMEKWGQDKRRIGRYRPAGAGRANDTAPYLGRASGTGGRITENQIWQNSLCPAQGEHRARLCRREGKAWNALYESQRLGPGKTMGHAEICMHESEKAGKLAVGITGFFRCIFLFLPFSTQKRGAGLSQHRVF